MTTQINETWAQGSEPGDVPIESEVVPVDPEDQELEDARARLEAIPNPMTAPEIWQAFQDILTLMRVR